MIMSYELPEVQQKDILQNQLYIWVPNIKDPCVVRLSEDGDYLIESGDFESDYWDFNIELACKFYGPFQLSDVDVTEVIVDTVQEQEDDCEQ